MKQAHAFAKLLLLSDVNPVLTIVTADARNVNYGICADPSLAPAPGLADAVAAFVTAR